MISLANNLTNDIAIDDEWNFGNDNECLMHTLHAYPAKFPAFIASKAFDYARREGVTVKKVSDIFCGCGTVALEAKIHGKDFWGCDINPVATLIAKTKSTTYDINVVKKYYESIEKKIKEIVTPSNVYEDANERLKYWFNEKSYIELLKVKTAIDMCVPEEKYKTAFLCLFSAILKASSRWLTKSIKPQIDPNKKDADIIKLFRNQYNKFLRAIEELDDISRISKIEIKNKNFLEIKELPKVDLVITSPPYVTSYEYADLHQLSSLWLGYTDDYRELRKGSIGSVYNIEDFQIDLDTLNKVGKDIILKLTDKVNSHSKVRSVARYYLDMQNVVKKCRGMLNVGGMVFFVVGDTEYKGVKIMNSEHLIEALRENGFSDIKVAKRRISRKILTPYRDAAGKFSSDKTQRAIYHEELIISGRMWSI